ncbi:MAG: hypothetical protein ACODAD_03025 [Planctomycetota bacterium]
MKNLVLFCVLMVALTPLFAGCGADDNMAYVKGTVTVDGEPIEGVEISFEPQSEGGSPSLGITDSSGHYEAMFTANQKGVQIGKHTVRIAAIHYDDQEKETVLADIPPEYAEESTITFEVEPGNNTFDLDVETNAE